jgi:hypothetical protein
MLCINLRLILASDWKDLGFKFIENNFHIIYLFLNNYFIQMPICFKCFKTFGKFDNGWKMDEITNVEQ